MAYTHVGQHFDATFASQKGYRSPTYSPPPPVQATQPSPKKT